MPRFLLPIAAMAAGFGFCLGGAMLAATPLPADTAACPILAERFFATEHALPDGRVRASYFVLLRNPEPRALAYALRFDDEAASDRRSGARASLPGRQSLPVLLGREVLAQGAPPRDPALLAGATRLTCRG